MDAPVEVTSIKTFIGLFFEVSFVEASIEFFVEIPSVFVKVTFMEAFAKSFVELTSM